MSSNIAHRNTEKIFYNCNCFKINLVVIQNPLQRHFERQKTKKWPLAHAAMHSLSTTE